MPVGASRAVRRLHRCRLVLASTVVLALSGLVSSCESRVDAQPSGSDSGLDSGLDPGLDSEQHPSQDSEGGHPFLYVALGDSYTAAHGVPGTTWIDGCLQSDRNYPNLVAQALPNATLVDVSCSGAATQNMLNERILGTIHHPPQFDALTKDTDLVTVSIGYNDFRLFTTLFGRCAEIGKKDPEGAPCRDRLIRANGYDYLGKRVEIIGKRVAKVVRGIRERAPEARIMVVSYPHLLPETGYCVNRVPLAKGDYAYVRGINDAMSEVQRAAAEAVDNAEYVDVAEASVGHDVCSRDPWVAGVDPVNTRAAAFHPFAVEQRAVADLILEQL